VTNPQDPGDFDAATIIAMLNRHGVHYVVIGALAAQLQGAPIPRTRDIDITPAATDDNLQRLSTALHELSARIRTADVPEGLPFDHDGASLSGSRIWNLTTPFGEKSVHGVTCRPSSLVKEMDQRTDGPRPHHRAPIRSGGSPSSWTVLPANTGPAEWR